MMSPHTVTECVQNSGHHTPAHHSSKDQHPDDDNVMNQAKFVRSISSPVIVPVGYTFDSRGSRGSQEVKHVEIDPLMSAVINRLSDSRFDEKGSDVAARRHNRRPGKIVRKEKEREIKHKVLSETSRSMES